MDHITNTNKRRPPTHPGAILREDVLPALKLSVTAAAQKLGVSRVTLHRVPASMRRCRRRWLCDSGSCAATARISG